MLPRGRKPVDFSIHVLANHPLGRDYRQDPLAAGDSPGDLLPYLNPILTLTLTVSDAVIIPYDVTMPAC